MSRLYVVVAAAASVVALSGCGASSPPAKELADEMIETLSVSDDVKACMKLRVEEFSLTAEEATGFESFDDVAAKADGGNELALRIIQRFEDSLDSCT